MESGEEALATARPDWFPTGLTGACFLLATDSSVQAVQPFFWPTPLVLLPILDAKGGTDPQGPGSRDC